ncbi:hypothetical protein J7643_16880 [bacterium]|nr:hypothetical protein [bacterium]
MHATLPLLASATLAFSPLATPSALPGATSVAGSPRYSPELAGALGLAGVTLALPPTLAGTNPALTGTIYLVGTSAGYWYQGEWLRAALTPVGDLAAGAGGFYLGSQVLLPLVAGKPYALSSDTGVQWAQMGALLGVLAFHGFVAWDAYRLAAEKNKAAEVKP